MATSERGRRFAKAATEKADEIGHPVDEETRREGEEQSTVEPKGHFHTGEPTRDLIRGVCEGGPMDGMEGMSRFPKGFVLSDPRDSRAWVYDYDPQRNVFVSRQKDIRDTVRETHAAQGANYDVRAFDWETMRGDMG